MRKILIFLVCLMVVSAIPSIASATAMDIRNVVVDNDVQGNATQYAYTNNMVKLSNGTIVVGYVDTAASEERVVVKYSSTNGRRWSDRIVVDDALGDKFHVCLAVNETSDYIHLVWAKNNGTVTNIYYTNITPVTWVVSTPALVAENAGYQDQPYIAHHINATMDRFVTVFRQDVAGTYVLYYANLTNDEGPWSTKAPVNPSTPDNQSWPCLAQNITGVMHLSFSEYNSTDTTWDLMRSYMNNTGFITPTQLNASHHNQVEAKLISSEYSGADYLLYAWNEYNATNRSIHTSEVQHDIIGDPDNETVAYNATNVSCMTGGLVVRIVWINTSVSTGGEIYTYAYNGTYDTIIYGRVTDDDYVYRWPSCYWYNGSNNSNLFLVTRGTSTDVIFYDFGNVGDTTTDQYAWIDNLIALIISVMGLMIVVVIIIGIMKPFSRIGGK